MIPSVTTKEMTEVDRLAVEEFNTPIPKMMEKAGKHTAILIKDILKNIKHKNIIILVGPGNNGGDGLNAALYLQDLKAKPYCILAVTKDKLHPHPKTQYKRCKQKKIPLLYYTDERVPSLIKKADFIIDCLLGYNIKGKPRKNIATLISLGNKSKKPILSMDTPSGLDTTTGKELGETIKATYTGTLALPKTGLFKSKKVGKLYVIDIGVPDTLYLKINKKVKNIFKGKPYISI